MAGTKLASVILLSGLVFYVGNAAFLLPTEFTKAAYGTAKKVFACQKDTLATDYAGITSPSDAVKKIRVDILAKWDAVSDAAIKTAFLAAVLKKLAPESKMDLTALDNSVLKVIPIECLIQLPWAVTQISDEQLKIILEDPTRYENEIIRNGVLDAFDVTKDPDVAKRKLLIPIIDKIKPRSVRLDVFKKIAKIWNDKYTDIAPALTTCESVLVSLTDNAFLGQTTAVADATIKPMLTKLNDLCKSNIQENRMLLAEVAKLYAAQKIKTTLTTLTTPPFDDYWFLIPYLDMEVCDKLPFSAVTKTQVLLLKDVILPMGCSKGTEMMKEITTSPCLRKFALKTYSSTKANIVKADYLKLGNFLQWIAPADIKAKLVSDITCPLYFCDGVDSFGRVNVPLDVERSWTNKNKCALTAANIVTLNGKTVVANFVADITTYGCTFPLQAPKILVQLDKDFICNEKILEKLTSPFPNAIMDIVLLQCIDTVSTALTDTASITKYSTMLKLMPYTKITAIATDIVTNFEADNKNLYLPQIETMDESSKFAVVSKVDKNKQNALKSVVGSKSLSKFLTLTKACELTLDTFKAASGKVPKFVATCMWAKGVTGVASATATDLRNLLLTAGSMVKTADLDKFTDLTGSMSTILCADDVFPYVPDDVKKTYFDKSIAALKKRDLDADGIADDVVRLSELQTFGKCAVYLDYNDICDTAKISNENSLAQCYQIGHANLCKDVEYLRNVTAKCLACMKSETLQKTFDTLGSLACELTKAQYDSLIGDTAKFNTVRRIFGMCKSMNKELEDAVKLEMAKVKLTDWTGVVDAMIDEYGNLMALAPDTVMNDKLIEEPLAVRLPFCAKMDDDMKDEKKEDCLQDKERTQLAEQLHKIINDKALLVANTLGTATARRKRSTTVTTPACSDLEVMKLIPGKIQSLTADNIKAIKTDELNQCFPILCEPGLEWSHRAVLDRILADPVFAGATTLNKFTTAQLSLVKSCLVKLTTAEIDQLLLKVADDNIIALLGSNWAIEQSEKEKILEKIMTTKKKKVPTATLR